MRDRRDHGPLVVRHGRRRSFPNMIVEREIRTDRHVVPRHEPQTRNVQLHVVVVEATVVPGGVVWRALNHAAAGFDRHRVGEDAVGRVDGFQDVLHRQMPERLRPVDRRQMLREIERFRRANQIVARRIGRKHRAHLVLLAVNPGDEEHLHGAAPIPVALLVVGTDAAHAGTESLDVHGRICRVPECGDAHLILRRRRAPGGPDLPVRPRLLRQPVDGVVAVASRRAEDVVVALGEEVAAFVLHDVRVSPFHCREGCGHVGRHAVVHIPEVEVVRRPDPDDGHLAGSVLRPIDVGGQTDAIRHRHHHLPLDNGQRLELVFGLDPPRPLGGRQRPLLLGANDDRGTEQCKRDCRFQIVDCRFRFQIGACRCRIVRSHWTVP